MPTGRDLDWTSSCGVMFPSMFPLMSFGVWTAMPSSPTGMGQVLKIANLATANFAIIFAGLSDTHGLERYDCPLL